MISELKHHPIGEPIPEGWRIADQAPSHHGKYSVLIERIPDDAPQVAVRYDHMHGIELMIWRRGERDVELVRLTPRKAMTMAHELLGWALIASAPRGE